MLFRMQWRVALMVALLATVGMGVWQSAAAEEDAVHIVSGVLKKVDKDTKTVVVKAADGTEHTIKYTDKTSMKGIKDADKGLVEGSKVTVKYTEKAGEKTAVGIKHAAKDVGDTMK
jgi:VCBS repeat-containing protein